MSRIKKSLKRLNCGTLALVMLIYGVIMFFAWDSSFVRNTFIPFYVFILVFFKILETVGEVFLYIILTVQVILSIVCFWAVKNNKSSAVPLALMGGYLGGAIAASTVNKGFAQRHIINLIYVAELFLFVIYPVISFFIIALNSHY